MKNRCYIYWFNDILKRANKWLRKYPEWHDRQFIISDGECYAEYINKIRNDQHLIKNHMNNKSQISVT